MKINAGMQFSSFQFPAADLTLGMGVVLSVGKHGFVVAEGIRPLAGNNVPRRYGIPFHAQYLMVF